MVNYWNSSKFGPCTIFANFFVYCYESRWIHQVRTLVINKRTSRSANLFRFVDDLTAINDGGNLKEVVKKFTLLTLRSQRNNDFLGVFFLDLWIKVERKKINIQVYDKKDDFPFLICKNLFYIWSRNVSAAFRASFFMPNIFKNAWNLDI